MIKSLFRLSLRMVIDFVQSLIKLCGWAAPNSNDIRIPPFIVYKSILKLQLAIKKLAMASIYLWIPLI